MSKPLNIAGAGLLALVLTASTALACETAKVTICHHNEGQGGGWVSIEVAQDAVDSDGNGDHNRDGHQGGQDIIPAGPFDVDGRNLDTVYDGVTGATILAAGCVIPVVPEPSPSPSVSPSPSPSLSPSPEPSPSPSPSVTPEPSPSPSSTPEPSPSVTPEPSPTPTATPSPDPSPEPSLEPSPTPSITPSPSPTPTVTPTITPSPTPTTTPRTLAHTGANIWILPWIGSLLILLGFALVAIGQHVRGRHDMT